MAERAPLLTTGELARRTGSTLRTVRFYEEAGLLEPACRDGKGTRRFAPEAVERLRFVLDLREAGLSLAEVRELLAIRRSATGRREAVERLADALQQRIEATRRRIERLQQLERQLVETRALLAGCGQCDVEERPGCCRRCPRLSDPTVPVAAHILWCQPVEER